MNKKVLVAMSGGVDSSAAAYILQKEGYEVAGATMKFLKNEETEKNIEDAKKVCDNLNIEHFVLDFCDDFEDIVIQDFLDNYKNGMTPNPCIVCNKYFKFGKFLEEALKRGFDYIATGHYAFVTYNEVTNRYELRKSNATGKDQSYVLYNMTQEMLSHIIFPLAKYEDKDEIRSLAKEAGLEVASKADSQEICFIPDNDYAKFIENKIGKFAPGNIVDTSGKILGKHDGIINYTVGQRKGLGISHPTPLFVVNIDIKKNEVVVGEESEIFNKELNASSLNFIPFEKVIEPLKCKAKIRYSAKEQSCTVYPENEETVKVVFDEPQRAITKGQSVVFYREDEILGGGIIR